MSEANPPARERPSGNKTLDQTVAPAWRQFIHYCSELRHGEIERLSIQDGLPVLAEVIKKKIKFT